VRLAHPEWDAEQVATEVARLNAAGAAAVGGFVPTAPGGAGTNVPQAALTLPAGAENAPPGQLG
jgi:hypothetical protein